MKELLPIRHILLYSTLITKAKNFKVGILSSLFFIKIQLLSGISTVVCIF